MVVEQVDQMLKDSLKWNTIENFQDMSSDVIVTLEDRVIQRLPFDKNERCCDAKKALH